MQDFGEVFKKNYTGTESLELVIQKMREAGASQAECVKTLISELKLSLPDADDIVINSKAWSDYFDRTNKLRNLFNEESNKLFD